jgi:hypothetical protein
MVFFVERDIFFSLQKDVRALARSSFFSGTQPVKGLKSNKIKEDNQHTIIYKKH